MSSRLSTALAAYGFAALGIFIVAVPWTPVWERATLALVHSSLDFVRRGWFRGLVSGIGLLDLLVAMQATRHLWYASRKKQGGTDVPPSRRGDRTDGPGG